MSFHRHLPQSRHSGQSRQSGVTLVESAMVLGIVAVMAGVAAPRLEDLRDSRLVDVAAAQLRTDVQLARSTAVALGHTVRLKVQSDAAGSCYVLHTGPAGSCSCSPTGTASCTDPAQLLRAAAYGSAQGLALQANVGSMAFEPIQGTVTPTGTLTMSNRRGDQLKVVVNVMGRARTCKAAGDLHGHPTC